MSGISKTIEEIKELNSKLEKNTNNLNLNKFERAAANSIMPIITAYEQSQADAEHYKKLATSFMSKKVLAEMKLNEANKRIAELERKIYRYKKGFARKVMSKPGGADQ